MSTHSVKHEWYKERRWSAVIIVVSLLTSYGLTSLAINSGRLLQYFAALALLRLAINRFVHIIYVTIGKEKV